VPSAVVEPIRTASIVGARPQFVKLAPIVRAMQCARLPIDDQIIHTGQHYDDALSRIFFDELAIPQPTANLGIGSGPQGQQTARMLEAVETFLTQARPDLVIVYGDTNSTLAGALAAAKMHIPVAHVEAGLRSFNRRMPEEINRIVTDHLAQLLFAPTQTAIDNLTAEGLHAGALLTGDVMYDAVLFNAQRARHHSTILKTLRLTAGGYGVATLHRAENTGAHELRRLLGTLNDAAARFGRIVLPLHPRTAAVLQKELSDWRPLRELVVTSPVAYRDMLALIQGASWILTDSGGLQKEAYFLGCPCVTLRDETEWVETLQNGANRIAGSDGGRVMEILSDLAERPSRSFERPVEPADGPFGAGRAAQQIVEAICHFGESSL
jgi:UDP-GlcNAc3NAcA epimerase